jgi:hypothetical protein
MEKTKLKIEIKNRKRKTKGGIAVLGRANGIRPISLFSTPRQPSPRGPTRVWRAHTRFLWTPGVRSIPNPRSVATDDQVFRLGAQQNHVVAGGLVPWIMGRLPSPRNLRVPSRYQVGLPEQHLLPD